MKQRRTTHEIIPVVILCGGKGTRLREETEYRPKPLVKVTDLQAALGLSQLTKLPRFIKTRKANFKRLYTYLQKYRKFFILPEWLPEADPSWFGFIITVKEAAPFTKLELVSFLESKNVATRAVFAGNLTKHPVFAAVTYRVAGDLKNTDTVMGQTFWIGVYPGITPAMLAYVERVFDLFMARYA